MKKFTFSNKQNSINANTGEIKAKLEPRYAGILPLHKNRYKSVPIPLNSRTVAGLTLNKIGTSTVEPNMAKRCCKLRGIVF